MKIADYQCNPNAQEEQNPSLLQALNLSYPDAYFHGSDLVTIAKAEKKQMQTPYCALPLCHTVEAESMGANITYGDGTFGPRAGKPCCSTLEEILTLPGIQFGKGRMRAVLEACHMLHQEKIPVVLKVSGPFTILGTMMDMTVVFRQARKDPQLFQQVLDRIQKELIAYVKESLNQGVTMISYADSAGSLSILGPKRMEEFVERFTYPFLTKLSQNTKGKAVVILCPKTTFALIGTRKASLQEVEIPENLTYQQACTKLGVDLEMVGQTCLQNNQVLHGKIQRIKL